MIRRRSLAGPEPPTHPDCSPTSPPVYEEGERLTDPYPIPSNPPKDWRDVPVPAFLAGRPRDRRGYPVFYTVEPPGGVPEDGKVDFRVLKVARHIEAHQRQRCALCFKPLGRPLIFIGGPMCVQNRVFGDGAMHLECANYARQVCPFLINSRMEYARTLSERYDVMSYDTNLSLTKPERVVLYATDECRMIPVPPSEGKPLFLVQVARWVQWFTADGIYLARTRPTRYAQ